MSCLLNSPVVDHKRIADFTDLDVFSSSALDPPNRAIPLPSTNPVRYAVESQRVFHGIRSTPRDLYYIVQIVPPGEHKPPSVKLMLNTVLN